MDTQQKKLEVVTLPIQLVKPYWRNPRNNEKAIDAIKASIRQYGFNQPIVVDTSHVIVAGHARFKALLQMGYEEVQCVIVDLPPDKVKQYRIADNKTSDIAEWDFDMLIPELREIHNLEDMEKFFPDTNLKMLVERLSGEIATSAQQVFTEAKVKSAQEKLYDAYREHNESHLREDFVEIICPHCLEPVYVERAFIIEADAVDLTGVDEATLVKLEEGMGAFDAAVNNPHSDDQDA